MAKPKLLRFEPLFGLSLPGGAGRSGPKVRGGERFQTEQAVLGRIARNVGGHAQVMVKVTSWGSTSSRARSHLDYITRNGRCPAEDEKGERLDDANTVRYALRGWFLEKDPKPHARKTLHMVLSMPDGTDPQKVLEGARRFAREEFLGRQYFMVLHSADTDPRHGHPKHPHVHLQVKSLNDAGQRLRVGPGDLWRYRQVFAEKMREQGVKANASSAIERGEVVKRPRSRAAYERQRTQANGQLAGLLGREVDLSLPDGDVGRLLRMAREDYQLVIAKLSRSQRIEDLEFAKAAMVWVERFPVLAVHQARLQQHAQRLREFLSDEDQQATRASKGNDARSR